MNVDEWGKQVADPLVRLVKRCICNSFPQLDNLELGYLRTDRYVQGVGSKYCILNRGTKERYANIFVLGGSYVSMRLYLHPLIKNSIPNGCFDPLRELCDLTIDEIAN
jgi:hypothetical protein